MVTKAIDIAFDLLKEDEWDLGDWENTPNYSDLPKKVQQYIRILSPMGAAGRWREENPGNHLWVDLWDSEGYDNQHMIDQITEKLLEEWDMFEGDPRLDAGKREAAGFADATEDEWLAHAYNVTNEGVSGGFGREISACPDCGNTHLMRDRRTSTRFLTRPAKAVGAKREGYYRKNPGEQTEYCPSCRKEVKGEWQERLSESGFSDIDPSSWGDLSNPAGIPSQGVMELRSEYMTDLHNTNPIISNLVARIHQYEAEEEKRMEEAFRNGTITMAEYSEYTKNRVNAEHGGLRDRTPQEMAVEAGIEAMREEPELEPEIEPELPEPEPVLEVADEEEAASKKVYDDMKWEDWRRD